MSREQHGCNTPRFLAAIRYGTGIKLVCFPSMDCASNISSSPPSMSFEEPTRNVVEDVIGILKRFSQHANDDPSHETEVFKHDAREKLENFISERREITLVLPAFPWKNRNTEKVIGRHPDLGEELGLARLNHLCEEIRKVYMFGARVHLIADGPVYNGMELCFSE